MREKRRFIRFEIALKVNYIAERDLRIEKKGMTKNINVSGILLSTGEKIPEGTKLDIRLFLPEALNPVHLIGSVMWSRGVSEGKIMSYDSGIAFDKVEEDNKNTFLKFLCDLMNKNTTRVEG
jgi:c-di-GMP-binding flagellar brake protein YcgR